MPGRLLVTWAAALGLWISALFLMAAVGWRERFASVAGGLVFALVATVTVRAGYRRRVAGSLPRRGVAGWLARRSPVLSGVLICASYMMIPVCSTLVVLIYHHHGLPPLHFLVMSYGGWFIVATGAAVFWNMIWRQQMQPAAVTASASGSGDSTPAGT